MHEETKKSTPFLRRVIKRVGNPLEWSDVDKVGVISMLIIPSPFMILVVCLIVRGDPNWLFAEKISYLGLSLMIKVVSVFSVVPLLLALVCLWLRRYRQTSSLLVHFQIQFVIGMMLIINYLAGSVTTPILSMSIGVAISVSLLVYPLKPVLWGIASCLFLFSLIVFAEQINLISYAPLYTQPPYENGKPVITYTLVMLGFLFFAVIVTTTIVGYVITRWRDREEKLQEAHLLLNAQKDQLIRVESLAAVGSLVTGAAHEFRNPLGSSSALMQSLKEDFICLQGLTEDVRDDIIQTLDMAMKGQKRASVIAERLYSLSDSLDRTESNAPLEKVFEALHGEFSSVIVPNDIEDSLFVPDRPIRTILSNLLKNALAAGGETPPKLEVAQEEGELQLTVSDFGRGIPAEQLSEVFKPFFTGEKAGEGHGVGLGLYIVHELVTRMGGVVELESETGTGTKVIIRIPMPEKS